MQDPDAAVARFNLIGIADLHGLHRALDRSRAKLRLYFPDAAVPRGSGVLAETVGLALRWRVDGRWHALPCPRSGTPGWAHPEAAAGPGPAGLVDRIVYRLTVRNAHAEARGTTSVIDLETDIAVLNDRGTWPDDGLLVTAEAAAQLHECTAFLSRACFSADLGAEHDTVETQNDRFVDSHRQAVALLTAGPVAAATITVHRRVQRLVAPALPAGHTASISVKADGETEVRVEPDAQAAAFESRPPDELIAVLAREGAEWTAQGVNADYRASGATAADAKGRFMQGLADLARWQKAEGAVSCTREPRSERWSGMIAAAGGTGHVRVEHVDSCGYEPLTYTAVTWIVIDENASDRPAGGDAAG